MKILMIGGTGVISTATTALLISLGHDVRLLTRGTRPVPEGATAVRCDINDPASVRQALGSERFDVVVDWIVFTPDQAERDVALFGNTTNQYIFISSASAYQRPARHYLVTEETPLENPFWQYSRNKIACEQLLLNAREAAGFPVTIVRPSLTYGDTLIPYAMTSWTRSWTLVERLRQGRRIVVPGDGSSLWPITHNTDFAKGIVGLMGLSDALGEAFHITTDEVLTWDQILERIANAVGVVAKPVHISSEFISAFMPDMYGSLIGDKSTSVVFDNSKLKRFVPGFEATMSFGEGIAQTIAVMGRTPSLQEIDVEFDELTDRLIAAHDYGMSLASGS